LFFLSTPRLSTTELAEFFPLDPPFPKDQRQTGFAQADFAFDVGARPAAALAP
jgi:hypothetical protein